MGFTFGLFKARVFPAAGRLLLTAGLALSFCLAAVVAPSAKAEPVFKPGVAPGDCAPCHAGESMVGAGHPATAGMVWEDCAACHRENKNGARTLDMRLPVGHIHMLAGQDCAVCHEDGDTDNLPANATCQGCHPDYAEKTPGKDGLDNPHKNHLGEPDCWVCHKVHEPSVDLCVSCHATMQYSVP